jgi:hypothetical protein
MPTDPVSATERLRRLYERKARVGLVNVRFDLTEAARSASVEEIAAEVLAVHEAIQAGRTKLLDFGDFSLKRSGPVPCRMTP